VLATALLVVSFTACAPAATPTATPEPPTATPAPPTATPVPPTATSEPATATPTEAPATATPEPTEEATAEPTVEPTVEPTEAADSEDEEVSAEMCATCHPFEDLMAKTEGAIEVEGQAVNPHMYVPHDSTDPYPCDMCHTPHKLPAPEGDVETPAGVEACFSCHHMATFEACADCHDE